MKISDRFLDYGLTGGFFLTLQMALLFSFFPEIWPKMVGLVIPPTLQGSVNPVLSALGIVAIFFTGALLDLFVPFYAYAETYEIRRHLLWNKDWLQEVLVASTPGLKKDLEMLWIFQNPTVDKLEGRKWIKVVLDDYRRNASQKAWLHRVWQNLRNRFWFSPVKRTLVTECQRLVAFLHSYIFLYSEASQLEMLVTRMHLWQIIRAFSTAIILLSFELGVLVLRHLILNLHQLPLYQTLLKLFLSIIVMALAIYYAWYIIMRAFSRVCMSLFSLVYFVSRKQLECR